MKIHNVLKNTKGFAKAAESALKWRLMRNKQEVERRVKILSFWEKHGTETTKDAFGVGRATLYRWQKDLNDNGGNIQSLDPKSTAPKRRRNRVIPDAVRDLILKERSFDPHLGKDKLAALIKEDGLGTYSASTVGRMLSDLKKQGILPDPQKLSFHAKTGRHHVKKTVSKQKKRSRGHTGSLAKADTVVRFVDGIRRYIVTAIDTETKFAFAYTYPNHSSKAASHLMEQFTMVAPIPVTHVQTDNGSEFAAHFDVFLDTNGIEHFHTYPRCPKQNAEIERFNRTLWESFARYHRTTLAHDTDTFNEKLMDWLVWYNTRRPHQTLGQIAPLRYICDQLPERESQMCWTSTKT